MSHTSCVPVPAVGGSGDVCANCGKHGSSNVKLRNCAACYLVMYCGVDCQRAHRNQHKKACKERAAELEDEQLFSQGLERREGDCCSICTLPVALPVDSNSVINACCMKRICHGCDFAAQKRGLGDCPFCRTPLPNNDADELAMVQARVAKKDPAAIFFLGQQYFLGKRGLQQDARKAVELYTEAAKLGSVDALPHLGYAYLRGEGVKRDDVQAMKFFQKGAIQGDAESRHKLGYKKGLMGEHDRAVKHLLISAKMGHEESLNTIKKMCMAKLATKEHYGQALKGYQDAVEETKSHDRDEAKKHRTNTYYTL